MSDEAQEAGSAPKPSTDDFVEAAWDVAVIPGENISIHYRVSPKDPKNSITSVSASVVEMRNHMVVHSFFGSTTSDSLAPKEGQGALGDTGADLTVFDDYKGSEGSSLVAILAGTVRTGEDQQNYFFSKPVELGAVEQNEGTDGESSSDEEE